MADRRDRPYIWATWLAKLMAGDAPCPWQYWFRTHYELTERHPDDFDVIGWRIDHERMVNELRRDLASKGIKPIGPYRFKIPAGHSTGVIVGEIDLLIVRDRDFLVHDCKTGMPRSVHMVQVMTYMHALLRQVTFASKTPMGIVVYKEHRVEIPLLPRTFASNFEFFSDLLSDETPAARNPGEWCAKCELTATDCPERY